MSKDNVSKRAPADTPAADEFELSLEDTLAQKLRGLPADKRVSGSGYNPYDTTPVGGKAQDEPRRPTDLRKLSEWIRLRRQVEALKKEEPEK